MDLAADARIRPVDDGPLGPTLSLDELAADRLLALFDRARARDFVDVAALVERFGLGRLCELASKKDSRRHPFRSGPPLRSGDVSAPTATDVSRDLPDASLVQPHDPATTETTMSNISPPHPPGRPDTSAGWYPDPFARHEFRYWDGAVWTYAVSDAGARSDDTRDRHVDAMTGQRHRHRDEAETDGRSRSAGRFVGFWTTLPGVLTAIAAVITAAGGILIATGGDDGDTTLGAERLVVVAEELGVDEIVESSPESSPAYGDYTSVTDDSGTIIVDVPVDWTDVDGSPLVLDDGTEIPDVAASSDLGAFLETYSAPGVEVAATDMSIIDVPTAMGELAPPECTSAGSQPYDDPAFEGQIEFFTDCGGTDTVYVLLAANYKPQPERIALVKAQIVTDRDFDAAVHALDTFNFN